MINLSQYMVCVNECFKMILSHKFGTAYGVVRVAHRTLERGFSSPPFILIKKALQLEELLMADRVGFEPTLGFRPKHTFQACAFNHSATYPWFYLYTCVLFKKQEKK